MWLQVTNNADRAEDYLKRAEKIDDPSNSQSGVRRDGGRLVFMGRGDTSSNTRESVRRPAVPVRVLCPASPTLSRTVHCSPRPQPIGTHNCLCAGGYRYSKVHPRGRRTHCEHQRPRFAAAVVCLFVCLRARNQCPLNEPLLTRFLCACDTAPLCTAAMKLFGLTLGEVLDAPTGRLFPEPLCRSTQVRR